jgi:hypothetical protein
MAALWTCGNVSLCGAAAENDGAQLFGKYCAVCHPQAPRVGPSDDILGRVRMPPPGMPAFGEDKLSDREARAIEAYLKAGAPVEPTAPERTAPQPEAAPVKPPVPVSVPAAIEPVRAHPSAVTERPRKAARPVKPKRSWVSSFVRNWSVKGLRNNETVTLLDFAITSKANNGLEVTPSLRLSDYTVKVTAFEIVDRKLTFELTWSWRASLKYWKIDTYELRLSDDGRRLTGTHRVRASGGQNETSSVWAE